MDPNRRFEINHPLDQMEIALVREASRSPDLVDPYEEGVIRTAISLARVYRLPIGKGEISVGALLSPFREAVVERLSPVLLGPGPIERSRWFPLIGELHQLTAAAYQALLTRFGGRLDPAVLDREVRHKALVLVTGGGGGCGYVYLGVLSMLDELGLVPALMAGTSIGAIVCLFRSRMARFDQTETVNIVRGLSWSKLFRAISTESRYGLPAAFRLFLRAGIGRYFNAAEGSVGPPLTLKDLSVPTIVTVSGIRRGMLPRPIEFYERLFEGNSPRTLLQSFELGRKLQQTVGELAEFFLRPEVLSTLHLGSDPWTLEFDALDAVGFSCALPGIIHYDVLREDPRMRTLLDGLLESRGLFRLIDGGLTDNLPAKVAYRAVQKGRIGTRNAFVLGLNAFSTKLTTPLWLPLQRLAAITVTPNLPYLHHLVEFRRTLSPLELVPSVDRMTVAIELGKKQIQSQMPFICRMLSPLPPLNPPRP